MSLLETIFKSLGIGAGAGAGVDAGTGGEAIAVISQLINSQPGGLGGMISSFEHGGLGELATSWVSAGGNLPISADQLEAILGSGPVGDLATKLGVDPKTAAGTLAQILPQVIDQLTPNGQVPEGGLGGLLGKIKV